MTFEVCLYAYHRERHGESISVESLPVASSVLAALQAAGVEAGHSRLAVNEAFVSGDAAIPAGARLALIPPVSGG